MVAAVGKSLARRNWWILGVAAGTLVVVAVVLAAHLGDGVTGNVAEWVGGLGAVAAFAVTYLLLREEVTSRREDRQQQARGVSVSTLTQETGVSPNVELAVTLWIHNGSSLPITQVGAIVQAKPFGQGHPLHISEIGEMGADRREDLTFDMGSASPWDLDVAVFFTDARGQRWKRKPNGELVEDHELDEAAEQELERYELDPDLDQS
jgi:hypothetical protein